MLISKMAKIVIFEANLDHPAPETPLNSLGLVFVFSFILSMYFLFARDYINILYVYMIMFNPWKWAWSSRLITDRGGEKPRCIACEADIPRTIRKPLTLPERWTDLRLNCGFITCIIRIISCCELLLLLLLCLYTHIYIYIICMHMCVCIAMP